MMKERIQEFFKQGNQILLGKEEKLKLALSCILSGGHLLLEDVPGVGKTTLVQFLGRVLGLQFNRIQFTNDLLPSDILGVMIYDQRVQEFRFHRGPIFGQLILADEINRASPKTQSALLEVMEEKRVSVDNQSFILEGEGEGPFVVVATQNPQEQSGTFPLPESQLDRFLMVLDVGLPHPEAEKQLLREGGRRPMISKLKSLFTSQEISQLIQQISHLHLPESIVDYVQELLQESRRRVQMHRNNSGWGSKDLGFGPSPRAGLGLVAAAKAHAFIEGRNYVAHEDIKAVFRPVMAHRLGTGTVDLLKRGQESVSEILSSVEVR